MIYSGNRKPAIFLSPSNLHVCKRFYYEYRYNVVIRKVLKIRNKVTLAALIRSCTWSFLTILYVWNIIT